ncbi:hypothetical protein B0T17DRAFT_639137 [Bombardia bombarda]|uniref:Uncharacterized protein n=1 Tax=Bombardia bombarda TaxID=252184 RepID=A0AA40C505_9PEZI|nr:hypothetical protein B0T17DRAFT_639137 [Bombardia bombarda]
MSHEPILNPKYVDDKVLHIHPVTSSPTNDNRDTAQVASGRHDTEGVLPSKSNITQSSSHKSEFTILSSQQERTDFLKTRHTRSLQSTQNSISNRRERDKDEQPHRPTVTADEYNGDTRHSDKIVLAESEDLWHKSRTSNSNDESVNVTKKKASFSHPIVTMKNDDMVVKQSDEVQPKKFRARTRSLGVKKEHELPSKPMDTNKPPHQSIVQFNASSKQKTEVHKQNSSTQISEAQSISLILKDKTEPSSNSTDASEGRNPALQDSSAVSGRNEETQAVGRKIFRSTVVEMESFSPEKAETRDIQPSVGHVTRDVELESKLEARDELLQILKLKNQILQDQVKNFDAERKMPERYQIAPTQNIVNISVSPTMVSNANAFPFPPVPLRSPAPDQLASSVNTTVNKGAASPDTVTPVAVPTPIPNTHSSPSPWLNQPQLTQFNVPCSVEGLGSHNATQGETKSHIASAVAELEAPSYPSFPATSLAPIPPSPPLSPISPLSPPSSKPELNRHGQGLRDQFQSLPQPPITPELDTESPLPRRIPYTGQFDDTKRQQSSSRTTIHGPNNQQSSYTTPPPPMKDISPSHKELKKETMYQSPKGEEAQHERSSQQLRLSENYNTVTTNTVINVIGQPSSSPKQQNPLGDEPLHTEPENQEHAGHIYQPKPDSANQPPPRTETPAKYKRARFSMLKQATEEQHSTETTMRTKDQEEDTEPAMNSPPPARPHLHPNEEKYQIATPPSDSEVPKQPNMSGSDQPVRGLSPTTLKQEVAPSHTPKVPPSQSYGQPTSHPVHVYNNYNFHNHRDQHSHYEALPTLPRPTGGEYETRIEEVQNSQSQIRRQSNRTEDMQGVEGSKRKEQDLSFYRVLLHILTCGLL